MNAGLQLIIMTQASIWEQLPKGEPKIPHKVKIKKDAPQKEIAKKRGRSFKVSPLHHHGALESTFWTPKPFLQVFQRIWAESCRRKSSKRKQGGLTVFVSNRV